MFLLRRDGEQKGEISLPRDTLIKQNLVKHHTCRYIKHQKNLLNQLYLDADMVDLAVSNQDLIVYGKDDTDMRVLIYLDIASLVTEGTVSFILI